MKPTSPYIKDAPLKTGPRITTSRGVLSEYLEYQLVDLNEAKVRAPQNPQSNDRTSVLDIPPLLYGFVIIGMGKDHIVECQGVVAGFTSIKGKSCPPIVFKFASSESRSKFITQIAMRLIPYADAVLTEEVAIHPQQ